MNIQDKEERMRKHQENKKKLVNGYKDDFVDFFRMKVTQEGAAIDPTSEGNGVTKSNSNNAKLPKRHKSNAKDSVESIASNV
jgi:hypothetical protein